MRVLLFISLPTNPCLAEHSELYLKAACDAMSYGPRQPASYGCRGHSMRQPMWKKQAGSCIPGPRALKVFMDCVFFADFHSLVHRVAARWVSPCSPFNSLRNMTLSHPIAYRVDPPLAAMVDMLNERDLALENDHRTLLDCGALPGMSYIYYPQPAISVHTCCECAFASSPSLSNRLASH